ncbi:hypothetical protein C8A00DRAFT_31511 [Chaetomidium leptoderma]|uniref:Extracellular membrane protein CFEM domain-containing protein n=1 Tax=Chaetomidium leptoderma TaxID=669021 RepID=A0AAN6VQG1_9PEZI|nr:hypothetical protein C8A00DRAFT_31511 [Chaetomidium leptoderma]
MHLSIPKTLLVLAPLAAAAVQQDGQYGNNPNNNNERGLISDRDSGDPVALVNDLSDCMKECAYTAADRVDCKENQDQGVDCLCKKGGPDHDLGGKWEYRTMKCFVNLMGAPTPDRPCKRDDYDKGKLVGICEAAADKPDKKAETDKAIADVFRVQSENKENRKQQAAAELQSSAAVAAAGPGAVARVAGAVLAAAVGYAVAMV